MFRASFRARIRVWILPLIAAAACGNDPIPNKPLRQRGVDLPKAPATKPEREASPPEPPLEPLLEPPAELPPSEERPADQVVTAEQAAPDDEKPERNLQDELETMIGSPVNCLTPRTAKEAASQVTISLRASVMPSGTVGRGEVTATGLGTDELQCLRTRLESLRFAQPIENAPLTVSASITLNRGS